MIDPQELQLNLAQFTGSEEYRKHFTGLRYTEGVHYLAQAAECYWLIDAIASHQIGPKIRGNANLKQFQLWYLHVGKSHDFIKPKGKNQAILTCWADSPSENTRPIVTQQIAFTDFPLLEIKLYFEMGVILLPSER